jgi:hypothetical protein
MTEATEQRPDGAADVAPAEPAAAPPDDLEGSLQEYQTATAPQPAAQPEPAANYDELDKLLDELSKPTAPEPLFNLGDDVRQQVQAQDQFSALQNENAQLRAHVQRAVDQADFDRLTGQLQSKLGPNLPDDFVRTQLLALATQNPNLVAAFDLRNSDRRAVDTELRRVEGVLQQLGRNPAADQQQVANLQQYSYRLGLALNSREILRRAIREVERRGQAHKPIDETVSALHDAVAAAVRGASGKASPEPPPNFGAMSDAQLRKYTKENFGF